MEKNKNGLTDSVSKSLKVKREKFNTSIRKQKNQSLMNQKRIKIMSQQTFESDNAKNITSYIDQFNTYFYNSPDIYHDENLLSTIEKITIVTAQQTK